MSHLQKDVVKVFDSQIKHLAELSKSVDQETRISVYTFSYKHDIKNIIFDKDVLRLPSLESMYHTDGQTALIDATLKGIEDLKTTSTLYGDHSFLLYVLTDGGENCGGSAAKLAETISKLPDNWTIAAFVPSQVEKFITEKQGFPKENIAVWSTTSGGMNDVGDSIKATTTNYMTARSQGIRSVKNLFSLQTSQLKDSVVKTKLTELKPSEYDLLPVGKKTAIKEFITNFTGSYTPGSAYYFLNKSEKIQASKQICVQNKKNGKIYTGQNARTILGLPDTEVKVSPLDHGEFNIFVQSLSVNRWLLDGTHVLVLK
jgi:hypothetical protein